MKRITITIEKRTKDKKEDFISKYGKLTEEQALNKVNNEDTITLEELKDILVSLGYAAVDRANNLPKKVIGSYSYYEGQINAIRIMIKLLMKLK